MSYADFKKKWGGLFKAKSYNRASGLCSLTMDEQSELLKDAESIEGGVKGEVIKEVTITQALPVVIGFQRKKEH